MPASFHLGRTWTTQPVVRRREVDLRLVPIGFLGLILVGSILLSLPSAHQPGRSLAWIDALFTAVSATCVTGLVTVNVADTFSGLGQAVVLALIQSGGLGIFTASISLVLVTGHRLSIADEHTIHATVGRLRRVRPLDVFIYACLFVLLFELAGTVALFLLINDAAPEATIGSALWEAVFHAVSAFCNAGISIYPENLVRWRNHALILGVLDALVVAGGIGLMTLINLRYYYFWRRDPRRRGHLTLQTRLALAVSALLLVTGTIMTYAFEAHHTLGEVGRWQGIWWSFFHSTMARTAGFNVVDTGAMNPPTLLGTLVLMFIGGSPGSMAGGIKTVTFAVLALAAWNALRRQQGVDIFGRRVPPHLVNVALMISLLGTGVVVSGVGLLMFTEQGHPASATPQHWLGLLFEGVSAFGTVGLSTGVTPLLTTLGKLIIIALMFTGRVAPLMLSVYLARPMIYRHVRHPIEEVGLG